MVMRISRRGGNMNVNEKILKEAEEIEDRWDILTLKVALEQYQKITFPTVYENCEEDSENL
jgi:hypothetical protein